jgi:hypothetical protein
MPSQDVAYVNQCLVHAAHASQPFLVDILSLWLVGYLLITGREYNAGTGCTLNPVAPLML